MNARQHLTAPTLDVRHVAVSFLMAALAVLLIMMTACGGGSGTSASSTGTGTGATATGGALVTLTDVPGDFQSYMVDVVSLKLTRADGTVVETVASKTMVDFAQLVNLSEVISAQQMPIGNYVSAAVTLDFTNATIVVDNGVGGVTVPAANIINGSTSAPLMAPNNLITVSVQLPVASPLVVTSGTVGDLALDFNLIASNTVAPAAITATTAASNVSVTVKPVFTASVVPDSGKDILVRGALASVTNTSAATSYKVSLLPFFSAGAAGGQAASGGNQVAPMGQLTVYTTSSTTFTINGNAYVGSAGLTALSALPSGTLTSAAGTFDAAAKTFTASSVFAGTSTSGASMDSVEGTVIARSGNIVTLSDGRIYPNSTGGIRYQPQISVTVAATTTVTERGASGSFGPQDISVGQHVQFFGTSTTLGTGATTLDASTGSAVLQLTSLIGQVTSSTASSVTMTLQSLDGQEPSVFNFAGTGVAAGRDAAAGSYVATVPAGLLTVPVMAGSEIRLSGFVTPFGSGPPDFAAVTLSSYTNAAARLRLQFSGAGVTAPFVAPLSATHVLIAQSTLQSAVRHVISAGSQQIDPSLLTAGLSLAPDTAASEPAFAIAHSSTYAVDTFTTFADFVTALATDLNGTTALFEIDATGPYDATAGILSVDKWVVVLND